MCVRAPRYVRLIQRESDESRVDRRETLRRRASRWHHAVFSTPSPPPAGTCHVLRVTGFVNGSFNTLSRSSLPQNTKANKKISECRTREREGMWHYEQIPPKTVFVRFLGGGARNVQSNVRTYKHIISSTSPEEVKRSLCERRRRERESFLPFSLTFF